MKLTWHIFRNDLRRLAGGFLLWTALYILHYVAFRELRPFEQTTRGDVTIPWILTGLWVLQWITAWVLVALLVQGDSLCTDRAAWRTRPISGARLLGAKLLGLALLFAVWPSLLTLPWWWQLGLTAREIASLLTANALAMFAFASLAAMVAALTPDILRFLGWSCVLVTAVGLAVFTISSELSQLQRAVGLEAILFMRLALVGIVALVGVSTVIALQYLRRRYVVALAVAASTAVVAGFVAALWPWSFTTTLEQLGLARRAPPQIAHRVESVTLFVPPPNVKGKAILDVAFDFSGEVRGREGFDFSALEGALRYDDNKRLTIIGPMRGYSRGQVTTMSAVDYVLSGRGDELHTYSGGDALRAELPAAIVPRLRGGEVSLHATAFGARWTGEETARLPFREGEGDASGFETFHLATIRGAMPDEEQSHYVRWVEVGPLLAAERLMPAFNSSGAGNRWGDVGVNSTVVVRGGGVTRYLNPNWRMGRRGGYAEVVGALAASERIATYYPETKNNQENGEPSDPRLFDHATLHCLVGREVAPLATKIDVPRLVPDLIIEGDLASARARARAEGKRLLMMTPGRDYDPAAQMLPYAWRDPAVRELLRTRFVCVQVFGADEPALRRRTREDRFPKFAVWTPEGVLQDTWTDLWVTPRWLQGLTTVAEGRTYIEIMRADAAAHPEDRRKETALVDALLGRGDVAEGVQRLLARPEIAFPGWTVQNGDWKYTASIGSLAWRLLDLATDSEEARFTLRAAREQSIATLARSAADNDAGLRLLLATFALQDAAMWREFPGLIPRDAPERSHLLGTWVAHCDSRHSRPYTVAGMDWEEFFHESRDQIRADLLKIHAAGGPNLMQNSYRARQVLLLFGLRGVEALTGAGELDRAQRLAVEVARIAGYERRDVRDRLVNILRGKVPEAVLREIRGR